MKILALIVTIFLTVSAHACGGMDKTSDIRTEPPTISDSSQTDG